MSYIVVYQREDGSSGLEECETLDLAVVAAERLRNVDSVEHPRIFKTEEVKFDFRPYYRVEVTDGDAVEAEATSAPAADVTPTPAPAVGADAAASPPPPSSSPTSTATIDPWAAVDSSSSDSAESETTDTDSEIAPPAPAASAESIDYSKADGAGEADDAEESGAPTPEPVAGTEADDGVESDLSRGLFSTASLPEPPKDAPDLDKLAEDVSDAVPPRRGLFGR